MRAARKCWSRWIGGAFLACILAACSMEGEYSEAPRANFEALWRILDENYCFFDYKGVDWQAVHDSFALRLNDNMDNWALFHLMDSMLDQLRDGHISLIADFASDAYDGWYADYPANFDLNLVREYYARGEQAGDDGEVHYAPLDSGRVGYIYYGSFTENILESELDSIFHAFRNCRGLIIDVRNNGGGDLT
ncbi:MAG: peptidase S41, partial [Tannerella sp.]|nr:peptidase S41 [Tannerella sp.]